MEIFLAEVRLCDRDAELINAIAYYYHNSMLQRIYNKISEYFDDHGAVNSSVSKNTSPNPIHEIIYRGWVKWLEQTTRRMNENDFIRMSLDRNLKIKELKDQHKYRSMNFDVKAILSFDYSSFWGRLSRGGYIGQVGDPPVFADKELERISESNKEVRWVCGDVESIIMENRVFADLDKYVDPFLTACRNSLNMGYRESKSYYFIVPPKRKAGDDDFD